KRVLAYSTVSQLGYMFLAMGVGAYAAGIFHLMTHAFFKACLFLGSGSVIHAMGGEQDMRKMGGLVKFLPATSATFIVTSLAFAAGGMGLAYRMYSSESLRPETFSEALGGLPYRAVLNKYWVDELYNLLFVRITLFICRVVAWFDLHVIDGIVDGSAALVRGWSWLSGRFDLYVVDGAVNGVADVTQLV